MTGRLQKLTGPQTMADHERRLFELERKLNLGQSNIGQPPSLNFTQITYTPTWSGTLGNGVRDGSYVLIGKLVFFQLSVIWGSTTSHPATAQVFGLPITPRVTTLGTYPPLGFAHIGNAGTADFYRFAVYDPALGVKCWTEGGTVVTNTVPFTFGVADELSIQGSYEID